MMNRLEGPTLVSVISSEKEQLQLYATDAKRMDLYIRKLIYYEMKLNSYLKLTNLRNRPQLIVFWFFVWNAEARYFVADSGQQ